MATLLLRYLLICRPHLSLLWQGHIDVKPIQGAPVHVCASSLYGHNKRQVVEEGPGSSAFPLGVSIAMSSN